MSEPIEMLFARLGRLRICRSTQGTMAVDGGAYWRHKVVTSEALGPGSVLVSRERIESLREEECLYIYNILFYLPKLVVETCYIYKNKL